MVFSRWLAACFLSIVSACFRWRDFFPVLIDCLTVRKDEVLVSWILYFAAFAWQLFWHSINPDKTFFRSSERLWYSEEVRSSKLAQLLKLHSFHSLYDRWFLLKLSCFLNKEDKWWLERKVIALYLYLFGNDLTYYFVLCNNLLAFISSFVQVLLYFYRLFAVCLILMVWSVTGDRCFWIWWCLSSLNCLSVCCELSLSAPGISRNGKTVGNPANAYPSRSRTLQSQLLIDTPLFFYAPISHVNTHTFVPFHDIPILSDSISPP